MNLGDKELANAPDNVKLINALKKYLTTIGQVICKRENGTACNQEEISRDVDDIVNLEIELSKVRMSPEDRRDPDLTYNRFTLAALKNKTGFDFEPLMHNVLNILKSTKKIGPEFEVIVSDVNYVVKAIEILKKTPQKTLISYFYWELISGFGSHISEQYRKIKFEFDKVRYGLEEMVTREIMCQEFTLQMFDMVLSRMFVSKHFSKDEKLAASQMIEAIQASYHDIIATNDWLDDITRQKSLEKLVKVTKNVGYPDWIMDDKELDKYYHTNKEFVDELLKNKNYMLTHVQYTLTIVRQKIEDYDIVPPKDKK